MAKAKFDIKTEATRALYAGAGVADLAVETVREYVAEVQTRFADVQKDVAEFDYSRRGAAQAGQRPRRRPQQGRQGAPRGHRGARRGAPQGRPRRW